MPLYLLYVFVHVWTCERIYSIHTRLIYIPADLFFYCVFLFYPSGDPRSGTVTYNLRNIFGSRPGASGHACILCFAYTYVKLTRLRCDIERQIITWILMSQVLLLVACQQVCVVRLYAVNIASEACI